MFGNKLDKLYEINKRNNTVENAHNAESDEAEPRTCKTVIHNTVYQPTMCHCK